MNRKNLLVHIVTWNARSVIGRCIESVIQQDGFALGDDLFVQITDNASTDGTWECLEPLLREGIRLHRNRANLGFSAAHNQGVRRCLDEGFGAMLVLNPDVSLAPGSLKKLYQSLSSSDRIGLVTPKLLRAGADLTPLEPPTIDAAGMILQSSLRHFDRGSGEQDRGQYDQAGDVFGGTGACLLISRECIAALLMPVGLENEPVFRLYPQLREGSESRPQLFDEAFFAYREDAELSWRAQRLGWRCRYEPAAVGYHVRAVVPENRRSLAPDINRYSVRNRFLLQIYHWSWSLGVRSFIEGVVLRNVIVLLGVLILERSSIPGVLDVFRLLRRSLAVRRNFAARLHATNDETLKASLF